MRARPNVLAAAALDVPLGSKNGRLAGQADVSPDGRIAYRSRRHGRATTGRGAQSCAKRRQVPAPSFAAPHRKGKNPAAGEQVLGDLEFVRMKRRRERPRQELQGDADRRKSACRGLSAKIRARLRADLRRRDRRWGFRSRIAWRRALIGDTRPGRGNRGATARRVGLPRGRGGSTHGQCRTLLLAESGPAVAFLVYATRS